MRSYKMRKKRYEKQLDIYAATLVAGGEKREKSEKGFIILPY